jgi:hypothetical protein
VSDRKERKKTEMTEKIRKKDWETQNREKKRKKGC